MEAQDLGFPYLPQAMRSSQGRGRRVRKRKGIAKGMQFFELLATVAEQLWQVDGDKKKKKKQAMKHEEQQLLHNSFLADSASSKMDTTDKKDNNEDDPSNSTRPHDKKPTETMPEGVLTCLREEAPSGNAHEGEREIKRQYSFTGQAGKWMESEDLAANLIDNVDDRPPLVSSCSSEDLPRCMENSKLCRQILKKRGIKRNPDLTQFNATDDDDNSVESECPEKPPNLNGPKQNGAIRDHGIKRKQTESYGMNQFTHETNGRWGLTETPSVMVPDLHKDVKNINTVEIANAAKCTSVASSSLTSAMNIPTLKNPCKKPGESQVRLSIKSFTVPEISVDLPESATVANLKKAVMEAAMNLLGGGLCVHVLLQGKKLPDEAASLLQLGISCKENSDSLGFMLEPIPLQSASLNTEEPFLLLSNVSKQPTPRCSAFPVDGEVAIKACSNTVDTTTKPGTSDKAIGVQDSLRVNESGTMAMNELPVVHHPAGALILHPGVGVDGVQGLAVVPLSQKKPMAAVKRRIRRPFTVSEVEALVQAVEKLGTGRWRDVKIQAFEHATHRTYVDLKDKWKTLVHTACIAPHQRRGEPVPQELLDRVMHAHSLWKARQVIKQPVELGLYPTSAALCDGPNFLPALL